MQQPKLKVFFLPAWYPSRVIQLSGTFIRRHAETLKDYVSVYVLFVCGDPDLKQQFEFVYSNENGISVLRVFYKKTPNKTLFQVLLNGIRYGISTIRGYNALLKLYGKPDLNHVHVLTRTAVLPLLLYWFWDVPYVITEHWSRFLSEKATEYKGWLRKLITQTAVKNSKGLSAVSLALKNGMIDHGLNHSNFQIVSNVVDTERFKLKKNENNHSFKLLHVSRLDPVKNVKGIIDAAVLLDKESIPFILDIAGEGPCKKELAAYASMYSLKFGKICFHGMLYDKSLVKKYQSADAFVLFSDYETQGCVLLEALLCGLPLIGSNSGAIPELVNHKTGVLVEPRNVKELKEAMHWMSIHKNEFDKIHLRNSAYEKCNDQIVAESFLNFYKKSLALNIPH